MGGKLFIREDTEGYIGDLSALDRYLGDKFDWRERLVTVSHLRSHDDF